MSNVKLGLMSKTRSRPPPLTVTAPPLVLAIVRSPPLARLSKSPDWFCASPSPPAFWRLLGYTPGVIRSMTLAVGVMLWKEMAARRLGALNPCAVGVTRLGSPTPSASEVTKMAAGTRRSSMSSIEGRADRRARDLTERLVKMSRVRSEIANMRCSLVVMRALDRRYHGRCRLGRRPTQVGRRPPSTPGRWGEKSVSVQGKNRYQFIFSPLKKYELTPIFVPEI